MIQSDFSRLEAETTAAEADAAKAFDRFMAESRKDKAVKKDLKIEAIPFPAYSPDLNPLDYSIWSEINRCMLASTPKKMETATAYKARLRRTALRLPRAFVRKAILAMPRRIKAIIKAKGQSIPRD